MAQHDVLIYNETVPQLQEIQAGDTYRMVADVEVDGDIAVSGTVDGRDVAADGALAASATQPGDDLSDLVNDIIASQAQAEAGVENTQMMTALRVAQAIIALDSDALHKWDAVVAPTNTNDDTEGYSIGSHWVDINLDIAYICVDVTTNIAVWLAITITPAQLAKIALITVTQAVDLDTMESGIAALEAVDTFEPAYACLGVEGGSAAESTVDATPRDIAAWNMEGLSANATPSDTSNNIETDVDGTYMFNVTVSFSGTSSKTYQLSLYKNGSDTGFAVDRKLGTGGDVGSVAFCGIITMLDDDVLTIRQATPDGGSALTVTEAAFTVNKIGS